MFIRRCKFVIETRAYDTALDEKVITILQFAYL